MVNQQQSSEERDESVPGIIQVLGPAGWRARIADVGPDVWEVILAYHQQGDQPDSILETYPHLSQKHATAVLRYYQLHPEEVDDRIKRNTTWTPEAIERLNERRGITRRSHTAESVAPVPDRTSG